MQVGTKDSKWQRRKKMIWILVALFLFVGCVVLILYAYQLQLAWTGFGASQGPDTYQYQFAKSFWDWLQLLVVPVALSIAAYWFNRANNKMKHQMADKRDDIERTIAAENQQATLLQDYLERISDLLLARKFQDPQTSMEACNIARAYTLIVLPRLNAQRKGILLRFLYESQLITSPTKGCILLRNADLSNVDLEHFDLSGANLNSANLDGAKLSGAILSEAQLQGAYLCGADMSGATLRGANLHSADLTNGNLNGAILREANLAWANLSYAWLSHTDCTKVNFSDAIVNGARYEQDAFYGANISVMQLDKMQKL